MTPKTDIVQIYYDLRAAPNTFDAAKFFAVAIARLRKEGYQAFDVHIMAPEFRNFSPRDKFYAVDQKDWRLKNLVLKLPYLIPGVLNVYLVRSQRCILASPRFPAEYGITATARFPMRTKIVVEAANEGIDIHVFSATGYAKAWARQKLGAGKTIVMPTRITDFDLPRDTPLDAWFKLYQHLESKGYRVFVIPDQYDVMFSRKFEKFPWNVIPEAALDLDLRLALYEQCHANIVWASGSTMLLWCSRSRFLIFAAMNSLSPVSDREYYQKELFVVGERPPFLLPDQEIDWRDGPEVTAEYMIERSEAYLASLP